MIGTYANTTIQPRSPISDAITRQTVNRQVGDVQIQNDPRYLMKGIFAANRGVSSGPSDMALISPQLAQRSAMTNAIKANVPLADAAQNASSMLAGQTARDQEGLSLASLGARQQQMGSAFQQQNQGDALQLIRAILGGGF